MGVHPGVEVHKVLIMRDLCLESSGAKIYFITGNHYAYHCRNILNNDDNCWVSSGSFPQSLIISLEHPASIETITLQSYNVRKLSIQYSKEESPKKFQDLIQLELDATEGTKQNVQLFKGTITAKNVKLTVNTAFDLFIAIYHLEIK